MPDPSEPPFEKLAPSTWAPGERLEIRTNATTRYEVAGQGLKVEFVVLAGESFFLTGHSDVTLSIKEAVLAGEGKIALAGNPMAKAEA